MEYFFILGTQPALSAAELHSVLGASRASLLARDFLLWPADREIAPAKLIAALGGTIKIGVVRHWSEPAKLLDNLETLAVKRQAGQTGKFNFGLSDYGLKPLSRNLGLELKKRLKQRDIACRLVTSKERTLSSVVVTQNKLLGRGVEIILFNDKGRILVGETLAVQPFKELSRRDYGRPARDDLSGMLPPKLAQIMINLAQVRDKEALLIDPFCGSGTILSEAMLLGFTQVLGSDISSLAVESSLRNIAWLKERYDLSGARCRVLRKNALDLPKFVKAGTAEAIVTEPYLGPQRGRLEFAKVIAELEGLYSQAIAACRAVLKPGGRLVMAWPLFYGNKPVNPDCAGFKTIRSLPAGLETSPYFQLSPRHNLVYSRPNQKVHREIAILEKL